MPPTIPFPPRVVAGKIRESQLDEAIRITSQLFLFAAGENGRLKTRVWLLAVMICGEPSTCSPDMFYITKSLACRDSVMPILEMQELGEVTTAVMNL